MKPLSIAHLASEMAPFAKVGGLGDVVAALAAEQVSRGHRVLIVLPRYRDAGCISVYELLERRIKSVARAEAEMSGPRKEKFTWGVIEGHRHKEGCA